MAVADEDCRTSCQREIGPRSHRRMKEHLENPRSTFTMTKPTYLSRRALAAICLGIAGCQTTQPNRFDQSDVNHDGKLSRDEINSYLVTSVFESRDADHDKKLTKAEWLVGEDTGREKEFRDRDANHDGVVTLDEALAYGRKKGIANKVVHEADKNKDGVVSREEMTAYYAAREGFSH